MKFVRYLALAIAAVLLILLVIGVRNARELARQSSCQGRLNQLQLALRNYESTHGRFPPAYVAGPDGTPWHSWRVLLLPFINEQAVYDQYRFDEPWNGPNNSKLADKIRLEWFHCPGRTRGGRPWATDYVAVFGNETVFSGDVGTLSGDITDGPENTILLVEIGNSDIHWMEPRDLEFKTVTWQADPGEASSATISSPHPSGPAVVFADRITAYRLRKPLSMAKLRALLTIAGSEGVTKDALVRRGPSCIVLSEAGK